MPRVNEVGLLHEVIEMGAESAAGDGGLLRNRAPRPNHVV
jgi:hypothetical protein